MTAVYPAVWGLGQLITGKMADLYSKKYMLVTGMLLQACALILFAAAEQMEHFIFLSALLGWGTAMVYPTFLATVAENTQPLDRARSIGIFRLWRDLGYAIGALMTGIIADNFGIIPAIISIGILTFISAGVIELRMTSSSLRTKKMV